MKHECICVENSLPLNGSVELSGAKNAVLVIMASLLLTSGKSKLFNVPLSDDVKQMIKLLECIGAKVFFDEINKVLEVDTSGINKWEVCPSIMKKMRASILVMGPLLAKFSKANIALPGGCDFGSRPIDIHLRIFSDMGTQIKKSNDFIEAITDKLKSGRFVLDYPSVGATENILMAAALTEGKTEIINAALEPEVLDLISVLKKMGANIKIAAPSVIIVRGVFVLYPIEHRVIFDRMEAGSLLLAAAITKGEIYLPNAPAFFLDIFLDKLIQMGHTIKIGKNGVGIFFKATKRPKSISLRTMPYPGFPTDLQAPMMAALCLASGTGIIEENVYENRFQHVFELKKMGASINIKGNKAIINGVDYLNGTEVTGSNLRASCSLILAGLAAQGKTFVYGVNHLKRGYDGFVEKLQKLGGNIFYKNISNHL